MQTLRVSFPGAFGHNLAGRLELPDAPRAFALFAHCFTCHKDFAAAVRVSRGLAAHGIATLRFDFTGTGESEGDFADTNFSSNLGDLVAAAQFLSEQYQAPRLLIGHSLGGLASVVAAPRISSCRALCTLASPSSTEHLQTTLMQKAPELATAPETQVKIGDRWIRIRRELLDDLREQNVRAAVATLNRPLLVLHSPADETVPVEQASHLFRAAKHPKSFVSLDRADHLLHRPSDARYVAELIAAWSEPYISI